MVLSLLFIQEGLWAFDGWNNVNYITGEMRNPSRDLPRILAIAVPTVTLCYLLINLAYLAVLPSAVVATSPSIALDFGRAALGQAGAIAIPLCVSLSTFGALSGSLYTSARVVRAAARSGELPPLFAKLHPTRGTPVAGIWSQAVLGAVLVAAGDFSTLVNAFSAVAWTFYGAAVGSILVLRRQHSCSGSDATFRVWTPSIYFFVTLSAALVVISVVQEPFSAGLGVVFLLLGVPVYYAVQKSPWSDRSKDRRPQYGLAGVTVPEMDLELDALSRRSSSSARTS